MHRAARLSLASPPAGIASGRGVARQSGPARAFIAGLLALLLSVAPARAEDRIAVVEASLAASANSAEPGIVVNAEFEFDLPWSLEDAVNRGVALYFVADFELYRTRWYWFDRRVAAVSLTHRLTYSPLTRQYRVARGALALPFDTLAEALTSIRRIRGWKVLERGAVQPGDDYRAQIRMRLDTSQLPRPFQINALTNRDWTLTSDWRSVRIPAAALHAVPATPPAVAPGPPGQPGQ